MGYRKTLKKLIIKTIAKIPGYLPLSRVDLWFQNEARFGQQNTTSRLWAKKGARPRAVKQQQFEYAYLFGAVCPETGATEALIAPFVNKEVMRHPLQQIAERPSKGRHAIVIIDGAGWHTDDLVTDIPNVSILRLPAYSPELNPVEQIWQWLRQHELANRCFNGYQDIVDSCTDAWNRFIANKEQVMSL